MRTIGLVLALCLSAGAASSAETCKGNADEKKLAGAARTSFMTKCERDSGAACEATATERKLFGAARTSFATKCKRDAVGA